MLAPSWSHGSPHGGPHVFITIAARSGFKGAAGSVGKIGSQLERGLEVWERSVEWGDLRAVGKSIIYNRTASCSTLIFPCRLSGVPPWSCWRR